MSEQSSEYDPMSLHPSVDEIYTSQEMIEHAQLMRSISRAASRGYYSRRSIETIDRPDLFGDYEGRRPRIKNPPVSNEE